MLGLCCTVIKGKPCVLYKRRGKFIGNMLTIIKFRALFWFSLFYYMFFFIKRSKYFCFWLVYGFSVLFCQRFVIIFYVEIFLKCLVKHKMMKTSR